MNSDNFISAYVDNIHEYMVTMEPGVAQEDPYLGHYSGSQKFVQPEQTLHLPKPMITPSHSISRPRQSLTVRSRVNVSDRNLLCMSVRGRETVVGGADHALRVLTSTDGILKSVRTLYTKKCGHTEWVTAVIHLDDGRIVSGGMDSKICVWRGVQCKDFIGHVGSISKIQSVGTSHIISASYDRSLKIWSLNKQSPIASLHGHKGAVLDFVLSDPTIAVSAGRDGQMYIWDLSKAKSLASFPAHNGHVTNIRGTPDANIFVTSGQDGYVRFWDRRVPRNIHEERISTGSAVTVIETDPLNQKLVAVAADDSVAVLDALKVSKTSAWNEKNTNHIYSAKFCSDDTVFLGTGNGEMVRRNGSGELLDRLKIDENALRCTDINDEGYFVCATDDGNVISL